MREAAPQAQTKLIESAKTGERWAIELLLAYAWGKPVQPGQMLGADGEAADPPAPYVVVIEG